MSKNSAKPRVKRDNSELTKNVKYTAIQYITTLKNITSTQRDVLLRLIIKARYCPEGKLEKAGLAKLNYSKSGYYTRFTHAKLAEEMGTTRKTIGNSIQQLSDENIIQVTVGRKSVGDYSFPSVAYIPLDLMAKSWLNQMNEKQESQG